MSAGSLDEVNKTAEVFYEPAENDFTIPNEPGPELPETGGPGTGVVYLVGIMLAGLAALGFVMEKKQRV